MSKYAGCCLLPILVFIFTPLFHRVVVLLRWAAELPHGCSLTSPPQRGRERRKYTGKKKTSQGLDKDGLIKGKRKRGKKKQAKAVWKHREERNYSLLPINEPRSAMSGEAGPPYSQQLFGRTDVFITGLSPLLPLSHLLLPSVTPQGMGHPFGGLGRLPGDVPSPALLALGVGGALVRCQHCSAAGTAALGHQGCATACAGHSAAWLLQGA